jgi:FdhD protein
MVQKAAMAGMGVLAAVSAPTALAVQTAQSCGLALAGFVRGERLVAYTHAERFHDGH